MTKAEIIRLHGLGPDSDEAVKALALLVGAKRIGRVTYNGDVWDMPIGWRSQGATITGALLRCVLTDPTSVVAREREVNSEHRYSLVISSRYGEMPAYVAVASVCYRGAGVGVAGLVSNNTYWSLAWAIEWMIEDKKERAQ